MRNRGEQSVLYAIRLEKGVFVRGQPLRSRRSGFGAVKQLCGHGCCDEIDREDEPVAAVEHSQRVVRLKKKEVEGDECERSEDQAEPSPTMRRAAEYWQQVQQRDVGLIQMIAEQPHDQRQCNGEDQPQEPW